MRTSSTRRQNVFGCSTHDTVTRDRFASIGATAQVHSAHDGLPSSVHDRYRNRRASGSWSSSFDRLAHDWPKACIRTTHSAPGSSRSGRSTTAVIARFHSGRRSRSVSVANTASAGASTAAVY